MFLNNKINEKVLIADSLTKQSILSTFEHPNFYGILYFKKANGTLTLDGQEVDIQDHCIFFYYPYQKLTIRGDYEGCFLKFHPDFFCIDIHARDVGCQGLLFNNFFNDFLLCCSLVEYDQLYGFYLDLRQELQHKNIGQLDMVASYLKIFLIQAVRIKQSKKSKAVVNKDNLHHQIEMLITKHFMIEHSAEFYADTLNISISKFNRLCKRYFQNSFITILNLKKIAVAKNKLFLTNLPIKEIAYDLGYNDALYFSRVFRKHCGISPKKFREELKQNRLI